MESTRVKLARQALAAHEAKLRTAADKDQVRRQITAARARLERELAAETERTAWGYVDADGRIRAVTMSRSEAVTNARLNGVSNVVALRLTDRGTVACSGPSPVIRWEAFDGTVVG